MLSAAKCSPPILNATISVRIMSEEEKEEEEAPWACPWCGDEQTVTVAKLPEGYLEKCDRCERYILIRDVTGLVEVSVKIKEKQVE